MKDAIRLLLIAVVPLCLASCNRESGPVPSENEHAAETHDPLADDQPAGAEHPAHGSHAEQGHGEDGSQPQPQHGFGQQSDDTHGDHSIHVESPVAGHRSPHGAQANHAHRGHDSHSDAHPDHSEKNQPGSRDKHGHASGHADDQATRSRVASAATDQSTEQLAAELENADAGTIFARRILPILKADSSSSCTECHFAGVELRDFILENQAKTFASLKATGMIDVDKPDDSKLLRFIGRKPEKPDPLVEKVRQNELVAFRAWIRAAVREPGLLKATSDVQVGTSLPPEVIRHARRDRVLSSFIDNIWSEMGRCVNCHNPERNRQKIGRNGFTKEDVDAISWIVPNDPAATLRELVDSGNIDMDNPSASPVLTKPSGLEKHGGGPKFFPGSPTYRNFLTFLTDYADITTGRYRSINDLPAAPDEITLLSEQQLRITDIPADFTDMPLQVDIYRRTPDTQQWSDHRWATGFSRVNGKQHVWQNPILVAAPADSPLAKEFRERKLLPPGEYRIRILIDRNRKTEKDPAYELGDAEFVAEAHISGAWKPGYQPPKIVQFPRARD
ncbi:MAG: hypothetical protein O3B86_00255 [Planctomycetota bacterium]|nr:hypothetical protein [Planctomycetota bacterium]